MREIARSLPEPRAIAIGMAGARTAADRARILNAAAQAWPSTPCVATHDLEIALAAAEDSTSSRRPPAGRSKNPCILVLSGTGSCCYGRDARGREARVGGWGHLLGDQGSAHDLGLSGVRAMLRRWDQRGRAGALARRILAFLKLHDPDALISWARTASKTEMAALAPVVLDAAADGDPDARTVVDRAAVDLAACAVACALKLARRRSPVRFVFAGGLLLRQPVFARRVRTELRRTWPLATVTRLVRTAAEGAVRLARRSALTVTGRGATRNTTETAPRPGGPDSHRIPGCPEGGRPWASVGTPHSTDPIAVPSETSPTEARHPESMHLDQMRLADALALMMREDEKLPGVLREESPAIERAVRRVVQAFKAGGRLFYVGAGTSGRLGILDASECPPTFGTPPEMVQGIIAGGPQAVFEAVEGAEDDRAAGEQSVRSRAVGKRDVVIGIAASGRTPFVWGALDEARRRGACTILVAFNPAVRQEARQRLDLVIAPRIGPEILTGSTRLKAGTATKMILNMVSTLAMVQLGKVIGNLMVDLRPTNAKLRARAIRITSELTGIGETAARETLEGSGWVIKDAVQRRKADLQGARGRRTARR